MLNHQELRHEASNARGVWDTVQHMLRLLALMRTERAVRQCLHDLERVRSDLAHATRARDHARADFIAHEFPMRDTDRPILRTLRQMTQHNPKGD